MRLAYLGLEDPENIRTWSGIPYHLGQALRQKGVELFPVGPLRQPTQSVDHWRQKFYRRLAHKNFYPPVEAKYLRATGREACRLMRDQELDGVLSIHADPVAYLETDLPIFFVHDTTFDGLLDYYKLFVNLCRRSLRQGHRMQQSALDRCTGAIYSSDWAAESARSVYRTEPAKVHVLPFGANLPADPSTEEVESLIGNRLADRPCRLLLLGVEWERKGGPLAFAAVKELARRGLPVKLSIVGCDPPPEVKASPLTECLGFLDKGTANGRQALTRLFRESHYLIVPSRAECYGCVFCEANAYGLPAISRETGGVPTIIQNGVNGFLARGDQSAPAISDFIESTFGDPAAYAALARSSLHEYRTRLNWDIFSTRLIALIEAAL